MAEKLFGETERGGADGRTGGGDGIFDSLRSEIERFEKVRRETVEE